MTAIRPATSADQPAIDRVVVAAFGDHGEVVREMVARLRSSPGVSLPDLAWVAVDEGEIVGFVSVSTMRVEPADGEPFDVLNLTPLAVVPGHQGKGIGAALVEAVIAAARLRPEPLLCVEGMHGPRSLYSRYFASHPATITPPPEVPDPEAFQVLRLPSYDERRHVGQAVYPEAIRAASH